MPRYIQYDGEYLKFKDYGDRIVKIKESDYLKLMSFPEVRVVRPALEECLMKPSEVWIGAQVVDGITYNYYRYIKLYSNLIFVALITIDESQNFLLNNMYGYLEGEFELAEEDRIGRRII